GFLGAGRLAGAPFPAAAAGLAARTQGGQDADGPLVAELTGALEQRHARRAGLGRPEIVGDAERGGGELTHLGGGQELLRSFPGLGGAEELVEEIGARRAHVLSHELISDLRSVAGGRG